MLTTLRLRLRSVPSVLGSGCDDPAVAAVGAGGLGGGKVCDGAGGDDCVDAAGGGEVGAAVCPRAPCLFPGRCRARARCPLRHPLVNPTLSSRLAGPSALRRPLSFCYAYHYDVSL